MLVVFYHFEFAYFKKGFLGVDIFFVISGFLISRKILLDTSNKEFNLLGFYLSRIRRLLPALFTTILVTLVGAVLLLSPDALSRVAGSSIASIVSLANIRFWMVTGYFDVGATMKPLLHFWSLSVEEQFYLFWPLLFLFLANRERYLLYTISLLGLISLVSVALLQDKFPDLVFFMMPFRVYEFSFGAILAIVELNRGGQFRFSKPVSATLLIVSIFILAIALTDAITNTFPAYAANFLACLSALLLLLLRESKATLILLSNQLCSFIGKSSYSLYLVHWPLWVFSVHIQAGEVAFHFKLLLIAIAIAVAYLLHTFIEKPFRFKASNKVLYTALLSTFLLTLAICVAIRSTGGLPSRIEPVLSSIVESKFECQRTRSPILSQRCIFGDTEHATYRSLLIGDSHSMSLLQGLNTFGKNYAIKFKSISYPGCPPLERSNGEVIKAASSKSKCELFMREVRELLLEESFDSVFIAGRWLWLKNHQVYGSHKHSVSIAQGGEVVGESPSIAAQKWRNELQSTVAELSSLVGKVVILSQVPLLQNHIGECDKLPSFFSERKDLSKRCAVNGTYQQLKSELEFTDKVIDNLASEKVFPILPIRLICEPSTSDCRITTDDGLLYVDESHLSQLGGLKLIQLYEQGLEQFLFGSGERDIEQKPER